MTCNVFSGTLNPTQSITDWSSTWYMTRQNANLTTTGDWQAVGVAWVAGVAWAVIGWRGRGL